MLLIVWCCWLFDVVDCLMLLIVWCHWLFDVVDWLFLIDQIIAPKAYYHLFLLQDDKWSKTAILHKIDFYTTFIMTSELVPELQTGVLGSPFDCWKNVNSYEILVKSNEKALAMSYNLESAWYLLLHDLKKVVLCYLFPRRKKRIAPGGIDYYPGIVVYWYQNWPDTGP